MKKFVPFVVILSFILVGCAKQTSSLTGTWQLVSYGPSDSMTAAVREADASLTFGADGTVTGSGGCNSLGGTYEVNEETITFSDVTSTLMACDEPRMAQEGAVTQVLSSVAQFEIDDQTLTISANGTSLMFTSVPGE